MDSLQFKTWLNSFHCPSESVRFQRPLLMGVLNATPDSFSDGGNCLDSQRALENARGLIAAGADIIDVGGESARPGAIAVSADEELARVIPVIELIRQESSVCISIDTSKAVVMHAAIAHGANIINDITALKSEDALRAAVDLDVPVCLMHMQGTPETMQDAPCYQTSIVDEVNQFFELQIGRCLNAGIKREQLILDPGFGFGKSVEHNLLLLNQIERFKIHRLPVLIGVSRKSTLGAVLNKPVGERLIAGIAVAVLASLRGVAMLRTHDVDETKQALLMIEAILTLDKTALTAAPTIYQNIEFPAKAGIHVHSEIHGPRGRRRGDSVVGTAIKADKTT
ncbi:MAG: dihydropteroate synthase [Legionellales bacterium RIFCSPHIGHO2_12_FULL_42_9]|nr:MAG: dihydropteroate synthase [Legionellales bacterium RIFCSPHIGHO2_12_FULL_42_9]